MDPTPNSIARIVINQLRYSYDRRTGQRRVRRVTYQGVVECQSGANNTQDVFLQGPRGGIVWMTVWPSGSYDWRPAFGLGKVQRGHIHGPELEIASVEML